MTLHIRSGETAAVINPDNGAALEELWFGSHQLMARSGFLMAPWAGRIGGAALNFAGHRLRLPADEEGNAKHGLVRGRAWELTSPPGPNRVSLHCDIDGAWPGRADIEYAAHDDHLAMTLSWESSCDVPCILGIHPWFRKALDDGSELTLDTRMTRMVERHGHLPTGRFTEPSRPPWDDCFELSADPVLRWGEGLQVRLSSTSPWWVVFTEPADATCVEPQTAPVDAYHHPELQPETWPRRLRFNVHRLDAQLT